MVWVCLNLLGVDLEVPSLRHAGLLHHQQSVAGVRGRHRAPRTTRFGSSRLHQITFILDRFFCTDVQTVEGIYWGLHIKGWKYVNFCLLLCLKGETPPSLLRYGQEGFYFTFYASSTNICGIICTWKSSFSKIKSWIETKELCWQKMFPEKEKKSETNSWKMQT